MLLRQLRKNLLTLAVKIKILIVSSWLQRVELIFLLYISFQASAGMRNYFSASKCDSFCLHETLNMCTMRVECTSAGFLQSVLSHSHQQKLVSPYLSQFMSMYIACCWVWEPTHVTNCMQVPCDCTYSHHFVWLELSALCSIFSQACIYTNTAQVNNVGKVWVRIRLEPIRIMP